ncbi:hypothetical protein KUCAC02_006765, partial [Chaenocephalus aceratus]
RPPPSASSEDVQEKWKLVWWCSLAGLQSICLCVFVSGEATEALYIPDKTFSEGQRRRGWKGGVGLYSCLDRGALRNPGDR